MVVQQATHRLDHLSFKGNLKHTRYGWLRLTPAYSVHLVSTMLDASDSDNLTVLDPFCGTGTTALVCAEQGLACDTTDINPFLLWLGQTKTNSYTVQEIEDFKETSQAVMHAMLDTDNKHLWIPPLYQINKWWDERSLNALARAIYKIKEKSGTLTENTLNLLKIAFCRTMIEQSNASFGHQSMSFKQENLMLPLLDESENTIAEKWQQAVHHIILSASSPISTSPHFYLCDARKLTTTLQKNYYSCVFTSPPYPNRMSYIRELRPYMYWLGYLDNARQAGELDWQAIGGTWGCATSNLTKWEPDTDIEIPFNEFSVILEKIADHSPILSRYVHKYFHDMVKHVHELFKVVRLGGNVCYIVGNSKFYNVLLPVDTIFAALFEAAGFTDITISVIRKRSSKKELFEYAISARKM